MSHHELINWAKALYLFINRRGLKATAIKISPKKVIDPELIFSGKVRVHFTMSHHELIDWAKASYILFINSRCLKATSIKISLKMDFRPTQQLEMHPKSVNSKQIPNEVYQEGHTRVCAFLSVLKRPLTSFCGTSVNDVILFAIPVITGTGYLWKFVHERLKTRSNRGFYYRFN